MPLVGAAALFQAPNPQVAACGPANQQAWLCSTVYRITGNRDAAEVADALAKPLRIVFVVLLALVTIAILRRTIRHVGEKMRDTTRVDTLRERTGLTALTETERRRRGQRVDTVSSVLRNVTVLLVWTVAVFVILSELGVNLAPLIAGAGVLTVVIGFGAQTAVRDYLAGLFMVLEDQYGVGDVVDVGEATGTVEWVSLRVTRLRDVEGVVWWVPNGEIKRVGNKSQQWSRALLDVAVANDTDIKQATDVIKQTADAMWHDPQWSHAVLDEPEVWGVEDIGVGGIVVRLVVKTVPLEQWAVARELRVRLKHAFDDAGIAMPVPQQRITYRVAGDAPPFGPERDDDDGAEGGDGGGEADG
jgi:small conductance mechanosensitive channel